MVIRVAPSRRQLSAARNTSSSLLMKTTCTCGSICYAIRTRRPRRSNISRHSQSARPGGSCVLCLSPRNGKGKAIITRCKLFTGQMEIFQEHVQRPSNAIPDFFSFLHFLGKISCPCYHRALALCLGSLPQDMSDLPLSLV